ncbi:hypothetical protein BGX30_008048 [Mortierella sp. GBA39]|nr:hypothetical protein BGX30_008048 [Mortierella sp. GBA39]
MVDPVGSAWVGDRGAGDDKVEKKQRILRTFRGFLLKGEDEGEAATLFWLVDAEGEEPDVLVIERDKDMAFMLDVDGEGVGSSSARVVDLVIIR